MNFTLEDISNLINTGNKDIKQDIADLKSSVNEDISNLRSTISTELKLIKSKCDHLAQEQENVKQRLLETERKLYKYNFIVYGLAEEKDPCSDLLKFLNSHLNIQCTDSDFRDTFRLGPEATGNKLRLLSAETVHYTLKQKILNSARSHNETLKKHKIFVAPHFAKEDYTRRKFMAQQLKLAKIKDPKATLKQNVLMVSGESYSYQQLMENQLAVEPIPVNGSLEDRKRKLGDSPSDRVHENPRLRLRSYSQRI